MAFKWCEIEFGPVNMHLIIGISKKVNKTKITNFNWLTITIGSCDFVSIVSHFILFNFSCLQFINRDGRIINILCQIW
jgi:hypothetical protein